jgi:hypothetical protein
MCMILCNNNHNVIDQFTFAGSSVYCSTLGGLPGFSVLINKGKEHLDLLFASFNAINLPNAGHFVV